MGSRHSYIGWLLMYTVYTLVVAQPSPAQPLTRGMVKSLMHAMQCKVTTPHLCGCAQTIKHARRLVGIGTGNFEMWPSYGRLYYFFFSLGLYLFLLFINSADDRIYEYNNNTSVRSRSCLVRFAITQCC